MPNRYYDREREERNYDPYRNRERERYRPEYRSREESEWYETEQPEYQFGGRQDSNRFSESQRSGERHRDRATFAGRGSQESYGSQSYRKYGPGQYAGRGPKNYHRSDERITEDINERLTQHPEIDATDIEVKVQSGEVILTGTVDNRQAKRIAEDIAELVFGVTDIQNQLKVKKNQWETESSEFKKESTSSTGLSEKEGASQPSVKASIR